MPRFVLVLVFLAAVVHVQTKTEQLSGAVDAWLYRRDPPVDPSAVGKTGVDLPFRRDLVALLCALHVGMTENPLPIECSTGYLPFSDMLSQPIFNRFSALATDKPKLLQHFQDEYNRRILVDNYTWARILSLIVHIDDLVVSNVMWRHAMVSVFGEDDLFVSFGRNMLVASKDLLDHIGTWTTVFDAGDVNEAANVFVTRFVNLVSRLAIAVRES